MSFKDTIQGRYIHNALHNPHGDKEEYKRTKKLKLVDNEITLIFGVTGSGKSTATAYAVQLLEELGYTIIYMTGKKGKPFDAGMCIFPADQPYHLKKLKRFNETPQGYPTKFYNPITLQLPKGNLPPIQFYSYSLFSLSENAFKALFHNLKDGTILSMFRYVQDRLKANDCIIDFNWLINKAIDETTEEVADSSTDWIPIPSEGTEATKRAILNVTKLFKKYPILKPKKYPLNLNSQIESILNDKKHRHIFLNEFIDDLYYFDLICRMDEFEKVIIKKENLKICFVFEELEANIPKTNKTKAQQIFAARLQTFLTSIRSKGGCVFGNTQNYANTDGSFRTMVTDTWIMKCSNDDIARLQKDHPSINTKVVKKINNLETGEYLWWNKKDAIVYHVFMPRHRILEQGEDFVHYFNRRCHEQSIDYSSKIKEWQDELDKEAEKGRQYYLEYKSKKDEKKKEKSEKHNTQLEKTKQQLEEVKSKMRETHKIAKEELMKRCYELKVKDSSMSWRDIGKEMGLDHTTAKTYALQYAQKMQDIDFGMKYHSA